ncbi:MAG TPA: c-type cytochrome domain-containing protein [Fimbriimonas sp.]
MKRLLLAALAAALIGCQSDSDTATNEPAANPETPPLDKPEGTPPTEAGTTFASVQPIFAQRCVGCHGTTRPKEDLTLATFESVMKGSEHGAVVVPGKPDESLIVKAIHGRGMDRMPPKGEPLTAEQIKAIEDWIREGAKP